jgi:hypothetical protein
MQATKIIFIQNINLMHIKKVQPLQFLKIQFRKLEIALRHTGMMEIQISQLSDVIIMTYSRIKDFKDSKTWLKAMDLENFFNVYADKNGNFVYNLNNSIYFNVQKGSLDEYTLSHDMHWTLISYMLYGTTRFAWLLMKVNNITAENIF